MFYRPDVPGKNLNVVNDWIARAKFLPNSALFFAPCEVPGYISNHSMMHLSKKTSFRKSIQTFWLRKKVDWTRPQSGRIELK